MQTNVVFEELTREFENKERKCGLLQTSGVREKISASVYGKIFGKVTHIHSCGIGNFILSSKKSSVMLTSGRHFWVFKRLKSRNFCPLGKYEMDILKSIDLVSSFLLLVSKVFSHRLQLN